MTYTRPNFDLFVGPLCIGLAKLSLQNFLRDMKTLAWEDFCKHDFPNLRIASKKTKFSKNRAPLALLRSNII